MVSSNWPDIFSLDWPIDGHVPVQGKQWVDNEVSKLDPRVVSVLRVILASPV